MDLGEGRKKSVGVFAHDIVARVSLAFVVLLLLVSILAPILANEKPLLIRSSEGYSFPAFDRKNGYELEREIANSRFVIYSPIKFGPDTYDLNAVLSPPSTVHPLGTDGNGRDILSAVIWGSRVSLTVGLGAVFIMLFFGIILGVVSGYFGGAVDIGVSRLVEVVICFPAFFLIIALLAFLGPSILNVTVVIGVLGSTGVSRYVRAFILKVKSETFVKAARAQGAGHIRIMFRHLLPNSLAPVFVSATFGIASAILSESALSFLGFGVPPDVPSWGSLLSEAQEYIDIAWWLTLAPGFAIFFTVAAFNFIGEAVKGRN